MHREIMNTPFNMQVDHRNGRGYDNTKINMRNCTLKENHYSRKEQGSHPKGVNYQAKAPAGKRYYARIQKDRINYNLGRFATEREAAIAYNNAAIEFFGEFAKLNVITDSK
jgi:hypothetical protein